MQAHICKQIKQVWLILSGRPPLFFIQMLQKVTFLPFPYNSSFMETYPKTLRRLIKAQKWLFPTCLSCKRKHGGRNLFFLTMKTQSQCLQRDYSSIMPSSHIRIFCCFILWVFTDLLSSLDTNMNTLQSIFNMFSIMLESLLLSVEACWAATRL